MEPPDEEDGDGLAGCLWCAAFAVLATCVAAAAALVRLTQLD